MTAARNPYVVGPPVTGPTFYGRQDVFKFVRETLLASHQNAIVLYGQRRMGKTSILKELPHQLPQSAFQTVFFDLQGLAAASLDDVLYILACKIATSVELPEPPLDVFASERDYFTKTFLPQVYDCLENRRLLLMFDEFDVLSDEKSQIPSAAVNALFPYLRGLLDTEKERLSFVFVVGRQLDQLPHWILRIFKDTRYKRIWLLDREHAEQLITCPRTGLTYQPEAIDEVLKLTSCHPFFTQLVCYEVLNASRQHPAVVTPEEVQAAVPRALETGMPAFSWIWEGLDQNSRLLLSAIAEVTGNGHKAGASMIQVALSRSRVRLPPLEWQDTLKILVEWGILDRDERGRVSFVVELVRLWVLRAQPLREIKSNLSATLTDRFQLAEDACRRGEFDHAIEFYRAILKRSPSHPGAQLGLATALQAQGNLPEAIEAFEDAYWLDQLHSRDGLIETHLRYGEQKAKEGNYQEAGVHFRRVLELDPDNRAVCGKVKLLYDQGLTALRTDQFDQAVSYFERVLLYKGDFRDAKGLLTEARSKSRPGATFGLQTPRASLWALAAALLVLAATSYFAIGNSLNPRTPAGSTPSIIAAAPQTVTPSPVDTLMATPTPLVIVVTATPISTPTSEPTDTPDPTYTPNSTPTPPATSTPIIVVVTATPVPTPGSTAEFTQTLKYEAVTPLAPDNGAAFHGIDAFIEIRWEPVPGGLAADEYYAVSFRYYQHEELQYSGTDTKETAWQPQGELYYLKADQPERRYEWDVTVVRVLTESTETKESIALSPASEPRFFRWGD